MYHPNVSWLKFISLKLISAPPRPWLLSKPWFFFHSITNKCRPSAWQLGYLIVCRNCGFFECLTTRVFRFNSQRSSSRKYVLMYVSINQIKLYLTKQNFPISKKDYHFTSISLVTIKQHNLLVSYWNPHQFYQVKHLIFKFILFRSSISLSVTIPLNFTF